METVLGYRRGFFGLIESGWEIDDTEGKGARGPLPVEALEVESMVGLLDAERASRATWSAQDFHSARPSASRVLTDEELVNVRSRRDELFHSWAEVEPGGMLTLCWS